MYRLQHHWWIIPVKLSKASLAILARSTREQQTMTMLHPFGALGGCSCGIFGVDGRLLLALAGLISVCLLRLNELVAWNSLNDLTEPTRSKHRLTANLWCRNVVLLEWCNHQSRHVLWALALPSSHFSGPNLPGAESKVYTLDGCHLLIAE